MVFKYISRCHVTACRVVFKYDGKLIQHAGSGEEYSEFLDQCGGEDKLFEVYCHPPRYSLLLFVSLQMMRECMPMPVLKLVMK